MITYDNQNVDCLVVKPIDFLKGLTLSLDNITISSTLPQVQQLSIGMLSQQLKQYPMYQYPFLYSNNLDTYFTNWIYMYLFGDMGLMVHFQDMRIAIIDKLATGVTLDINTLLTYIYQMTYFIVDNVQAIMTVPTQIIDDIKSLYFEQRLVLSLDLLFTKIQYAQTLDGYSDKSVNIFSYINNFINIYTMNVKLIQNNLPNLLATKDKGFIISNVATQYDLDLIIGRNRAGIAKKYAYLSSVDDFNTPNAVTATAGLEVDVNAINRNILQMGTTMVQGVSEPYDYSTITIVYKPLCSIYDISYYTYDYNHQVSSLQIATAINNNDTTVLLDPTTGDTAISSFIQLVDGFDIKVLLSNCFNGIPSVYQAIANINIQMTPDNTTTDIKDNPTLALSNLIFNYTSIIKTNGSTSYSLTSIPLNINDTTVSNSLLRIRKQGNSLYFSLDASPLGYIDIASNQYLNIISYTLPGYLTSWLNPITVTRICGGDDIVTNNTILANLPTALTDWYVTDTTGSSHNPWRQDISGTDKNTSTIQFTSGTWISNVTQGLLPFGISAMQVVQPTFKYRIWLNNLNSTATLTLSYVQNYSETVIIYTNTAKFLTYNISDTQAIFKDSYAYNAPYSYLPAVSIQWLDIIFSSTMSTVTIVTSNNDKLSNQSLSFVPGGFALTVSETKVGTDSTPIKVDFIPL